MQIIIMLMCISDDAGIGFVKLKNRGWNFYKEIFWRFDEIWNMEEVAD